MNNDLIPASEVDRLTALVATARHSAEILIIDGPSYAIAAGNRKQIKTALAELERIRKDVKAPHLEATKKIDTFFRAYTDTLEESSAVLIRKIAGYDEMLRKRREAEQRALEEALRAKQKAEAEAAALVLLKKGKEAQAEKVLERAETEPVAVPMLAPAKPLSGSGISYRDNWTFEIVDTKAVPAFLCSPDETKIRQFVRVHKDTEQIPGLRIFCEKIPVQR